MRNFIFGILLIIWAFSAHGQSKSISFVKLDLKKVIDDEFNGEKVSIAANLPYYITTPIITKLLEEKLPI